MRSPPHPGHFLREEVVEANELAVGTAADLLQVSRSTLSNLLSGRSRLSPMMALRFERVFGLKMDTLLGMQSAYDQAKVQRDATGLRLKPFERAPVRELRKK